MNQNTTNDIEQLLELIPGRVTDGLEGHDLSKLVEIVLDLNRLPEARYFDGAVDLSDEPVSKELLDIVTEDLSFGEDNRAGLPGTLHRISAIRDRQGKIVGLTCRVGRAIYGTAKIIADLLTSGRSILMLGRPGLGKTTRLRDAARLLSTTYKKRVIIVDTSNEIAGDGATPHPAIGRSRRMQVPSPDRQAHIMIEAVENHTPEVIVIDEIGDRRDVEAARTIAERGVQLIATAHGSTIGSIIDNPMLSDLVGGCQTVVLGDDEAKKRGCSKSVVERKHEPTFDVVIEIIDFDTMAIYPDVGAAVDAYLAKKPIVRELRTPDGTQSDLFNPHKPDTGVDEQAWAKEQDNIEEPDPDPEDPGAFFVYTLGLSRNNVRAVFSDLGIQVTLVSKPEKADMILVVAKRESSVSKYKNTSEIVTVKSNSKAQIQNTLASIMK